MQRGTFHHGCQILSDSKNLNWLRTNVCKRTSDDYSSRQNALQYGLKRVEASKIGAADKGYVGHKAAKMMKRSKSIEARQQQTIEQKSALLKNMETAEPSSTTA